MDFPMTNHLKLLILSCTPQKLKMEPEHDDSQKQVGISFGVASWVQPSAGQSSCARPSHPSQSLATLKVGGLADCWYRSRVVQDCSPSAVGSHLSNGLL